MSHWLRLSQIEIISARAGFETAFPGDSHAWKMHAFLQVRFKQLYISHLAHSDVFAHDLLCS